MGGLGHVSLAPSRAVVLISLYLLWPLLSFPGRFDIVRLRAGKQQEQEHGRMGCFGPQQQSNWTEQKKVAPVQAVRYSTRRRQISEGWVEKRLGASTNKQAWKPAEVATPYAS